jgi:hypothetical protein
MIFQKFELVPFVDQNKPKSSLSQYHKKIYQHAFYEGLLLIKVEAYALQFI